MEDACLAQRTHVSQSQRLLSWSSLVWGGLGGGVREVITCLHLASLSFCFLSSSAWAETRAASSMASNLRSLSRLHRTVCFFWFTLDNQVRSSSVCPWGTLEFARKESHGWDFLARTGGASWWRSEAARTVIVVVVGGKTQHGKVDRWREREREMSTKIRLQAKICLDLTENESKCDANGSGLAKDSQI